jgi:hypothetical protein
MMTTEMFINYFYNIELCTLLDMSDIPIFFSLDNIPHSSLEGFNIWLSYVYWGFNYLFVHCG